MLILLSCLSKLDWCHLSKGFFMFLLTQLYYVRDWFSLFSKIFLATKWGISYILELCNYVLVFLILDYVLHLFVISMHMTHKRVDRLDGIHPLISFFICWILRVLQRIKISSLKIIFLESSKAWRKYLPYFFRNKVGLSN